MTDQTEVMDQWKDHFESLFQEVEDVLEQLDQSDEMKQPNQEDWSGERQGDK